MHPDTALRLSLRSHASVTERVYTYTQRIPPFLRGICGHPFHLRDAPIDRPPCYGMLHCQTCQAARLPECTIFLGNRPPGLNPGRPMCAWLFGSPAPSDANCVNSHRAPCWACLACGNAPVTHFKSSPSRPPRGASTPPACAAGAIWNCQLRENGSRELLSNPHDR